MQIKQHDKIYAYIYFISYVYTWADHSLLQTECNNTPSDFFKLYTQTICSHGYVIRYHNVYKIL